jgi:hypothetical protein
MSFELSQIARDLIKKARIVSFSGWEAQYSPECIAQFQSADDESRYLTDAELAHLQLSYRNPTMIAITQLLREQAPTIVDEARQQVLKQFPNITEPGGGLYPSSRADACWRDFWHFLRCITYGIAAQRTDYTSATGLHYMQLLYQELQVPLDAMIAGLEGLKIASLKRLSASEQATAAPYFDCLTTQLANFKSVST